MPAMNLQRDENWARVIECQFSGSQRIFLNLFSVEHLGGEKIVSNDMLMESLQKCCPPCSGNRYFHSAYFYLYDSVSSWKLASQDQYSKNLASMDDEIISWFIQAVIKSHHRLGDLYNRNWFLIVLEAGKAKCKVLADSFPNNSLPGLWIWGGHNSVPNKWYAKKKVFLVSILVMTSAGKCPKSTWTIVGKKDGVCYNNNKGII